jgi:hypothetical protein
MTLFLLQQTTVRLEVERTWHWFMASIWPLMGVFFISADVFLKRLLPSRTEIINQHYATQVLIYLQAVITLILAISIMDYY